MCIDSRCSNIRSSRQAGSRCARVILLLDEHGPADEGLSRGWAVCPRWHVPRLQTAGVCCGGCFLPLNVLDIGCMCAVVPSPASYGPVGLELHPDALSLSICCGVYGARDAICICRFDVFVISNITVSTVVLQPLVYRDLAPGATGFSEDRLAGLPLVSDAFPTLRESIAALHSSA